MENIFKVYDVFDTKVKLNSQVIVNNIGFEIPSNYYFEKDNTDLSKNKFQLCNNHNHQIELKYDLLNENEVSDKLKQYKSFTINSFQNYRNQRIYEFFDADKIVVIGYDGKIFFEIKSNVEKHSQEYFELYYIAFSFSEIDEYNYDNYIFQKNNYIILKNGKYLYDNYDINIVYKQPYEYLKKLNIISFNNYINKNEKYRYELENNYLKNDYGNIVEKIEHYKNVAENDKELLDVIEEN